MVWMLNVPQRTCIRGPVPSLWHYWEEAEPLRGGAWWEVIRSSQEIVGPGLASFSLLLPSYEMSWFAWTCFCHDVLPQAQSNIANWWQTRTSKAVIQRNLFSLQVIMLSVYNSNRNQTDTKHTCKGKPVLPSKVQTQGLVPSTGPHIYPSMVLLSPWAL